LKIVTKPIGIEVAVIKSDPTGGTICFIGSVTAPVSRDEILLTVIVEIGDRYTSVVSLNWFDICREGFWPLAS